MQQEMQQLLAYLASTDWYVIRAAEVGGPVPNDIGMARDEARARISEIRDTFA
jgi:hypothetical protein